MIYGYARVSTKGQAKEGYSLEAQEKDLRQAGAQVIYKDTFTGETADRPEYNKMIAQMKNGDRLIVTKLDRIARDLEQGLVIIDELRSKGISVKFLDIGEFDDSPAGVLTYQIFLAIAEFDKKRIIQRMNEGKAISGNYGGRKKKYSAARLKHAVELLNSGKSYSQVVKDTGISKSTLQRAKKTYSSD